MPQPTIGRTVLYQVTEYDANDINRRRKDWHQSKGAQNRAGVVGHVGNHVEAGDVFPAVIVRVWNEATVTCNLRVLLDGTDVYWATSRAEGTQPGTWAWPVIS
jgi:hypothetical protein